MKDVKSNVLNTGLMNILAMVVLYLVSYTLLKEIAFSTQTTGGTLLILLIGAVPAFLWLSFFYALDRKEPEPVSMVVAAFAAGMIGEIVFGELFGGTLFRLSTWIINANALPFVHLLFSRALIPALAIYFTVRYLFYPASEFNELVDGLMYGAFVGTGYAFLLGMKEVFAASQVSLYFLVFSLLVRLAIFAALGALVGYYFGEARLKKKAREGFFLVSLVISVAVFVLYAVLDSRFQMSLSTSTDLISVALTLVFSVIILAVVFVLIQRSLRRDESRKAKPLPFSLDTVSVVTLAVFLLAGLGVRLAVEGDRTFSGPDGDVSFRVPASYQFIGDERSVLSFKTNLPGERHPLFLRVVIQEGGLGPVPGGLQGVQGRQEEDQVAGYRLSLREYNRTLEADDMSGRRYDVHVYEYTAQKQGRKVIVTIESPTPTFPRHHGLTAKILKSLSKEA